MEKNNIDEVENSSTESNKTSDMDNIDILDIINKDLESKASTNKDTDSGDKSASTTSNSGVTDVKESLTNIKNPNSNNFDINSLFSDDIKNDGSGDITLDLINWLNNSDKIPSNPLSSFLANATVKTEFSLYFLLLNNMTRMKTIDEFLRGAESVLFNSEDIQNLSPDDLSDRYANANKVMDNLLVHTTRIVSNIKKGKENEEMDKLKLLLGAIPSNKLKEIISSLK